MERWGRLDPKSTSCAPEVQRGRGDLEPYWQPWVLVVSAELGWVVLLTACWCLTLGRSGPLSEPQFPHL